MKNRLLHTRVTSALLFTPVAGFATAPAFDPDPDHPGPGGVIFSQAHGLTCGDMDGDGIPDFIVGKRYWTNRDNDFDPDPYGESVLYWYNPVRDKSAPGGARFEPHQIDNHSGGGSDILAADMNNDWQAGHLNLDAILNVFF